MSKVTPLAHRDETQPTHQFSVKQLDILKNTICKGVTNEEFEVFLMACHKTQLDPFMRQIYAVKRWDSKAKKEIMTIQTGIDGYRLIAERTGCYAPGPEPTYSYDSHGNLISATAYIKKQTRDGTWHTVSASAYFDEYCQMFNDKNTGERKPAGMWTTLPRTMLSKCAEAQALRKAFPAEMSGVYTKEEMQQAEFMESETPAIPKAPEIVHKIKEDQIAELEMILSECSDKYQQWFKDRMKELFGSEKLSDIPASRYTEIHANVSKNMHENFALQKQQLEAEAVTG